MCKGTMKKKLRSIFFLEAVALCAAGLVSCGIEDYVFLPPVPSGNISVTLNYRAVINLPDLNENFTHFTIYYRIYISGTSYPTVHTGNMNDLNPALYTDYNAILPYTNNNTTISTSINTLFRNRNYYALTLEGADIDKDVLSKDNAQGRAVTLDFIVTTPQTIPALSIDNQQYNVRRSTGDGLFNPQPANRYFFNTPDLNSSGNVSTMINADVANRSELSESGDRYTYVSMYIVVTGMDDNLSLFYSAPTFIGVFFLPAP